MRALVTRLSAEGVREKALVADWPEPRSPTAHEVRTRTLFTAMTNGTDLNDLQGGNYADYLPVLPATFGYQNVGEVVEVGSAVKDLKVGDRLFMSQPHVAETVVGESDLLVKLPPAVVLREAALFGLAGAAMRSCQNADLHMGDRLLIVGAGCIGQIAAQIAAMLGARVTLCDIDEGRLAVARQIGAAEEVLDTSGDRWDQQVPEAAFAAVLDLAGVPDMEDRLIRSARRYGTVLLVAGRRRVAYSFNLGQTRRITLKQNSHFTREDLANVCRLVAAGRLNLTPLLRDMPPVEQAPQIYERLRSRPLDLLGVVFDWQAHGP